MGTTLTFTIPLLTPPPGSEITTGASMAGAAAAPPWAAALPDVSEAVPPASPVPPSPSSAPQSPVQEGGLHVLVAEDDALSQAVMRKVLGRMGLRHTIVANGATAVEAYRAGACCVLLVERWHLTHRASDTFDLVLMDLHMPVMDGLEATRAICALVARGERPYTPIVVRCAAIETASVAAGAMTTCAGLAQALTASCSDEERARCLSAGMVELMPKPIKLDALKARQLLLRMHLPL